MELIDNEKLYENIEKKLELIKAKKRTASNYEAIY